MQISVNYICNKLNVNSGGVRVVNVNLKIKTLVGRR